MVAIAKSVTIDQTHQEKLERFGLSASKVLQEAIEKHGIAKEDEGTDWETCSNCKALQARIQKLGQFLGSESRYADAWLEYKKGKGW
jgi:hypothetical protein